MADREAGAADGGGSTGRWRSSLEGSSLGEDGRRNCAISSSCSSVSDTDTPIIGPTVHPGVMVLGRQMVSPSRDNDLLLRQPVPHAFAKMTRLPEAAGGERRDA